jgi:hypothetical protein
MTGRAGSAQLAAPVAWQRYFTFPFVQPGHAGVVEKPFALSLARRNH